MSGVPSTDDIDHPFLKEAARTDSILRAVGQNDKNTLLKLLEKHEIEPPPLLTHTHQWTALHLAASESTYKECLELLLQHDNYSILVNIDSQTHEGKTALHIACENRCEENAIVLLQKGCNVDMVTHQGRTALHIAASLGCTELVRYLLEKGADSQLIDYKRNLPLHLACWNGPQDCIRLLLEKNCASVNYPNLEGSTPFMLATLHLDVEILEYMIRNGAETDIALFSLPSRRSDVFPFLLQSMDVSCIERFYLSIFEEISSRDTSRSRRFASLTCLTLEMVPDSLAVLIASQVPRHILQMPEIVDHSTYVSVLSPLAYLFTHYSFGRSRKEIFDQFLHLLLEHEITLMDELRRVVKMNWTCPDMCFFDVFLYLFDRCLFSPDEEEYYFNLLISNGVTTDYTLQCYHDTTDPFATFDNYKLYYIQILRALEMGNIENVKLLISNSVILEPDVLCCHLIESYDPREISPQIYDSPLNFRNMYHYLRSLKPCYYKQEQPNFENLPSSLICTVNEEFTNATLQQLCRTVVRQQLREPTLENNLCNFRCKISQLPLPPSLKGYLLFKS